MREKLIQEFNKSQASGKAEGDEGSGDHTEAEAEQGTGAEGKSNIENK